MQVVLVMFRGDGDRRSFSVARDMTVIGRREDCDLRIPVGDVSRKHCRLIKDGEALKVEDLGSSNGTYVNNQRVQEAWLAAGDVVQVGPVQFVVQVDGVPADEVLAAASVGSETAVGEPSLEEVTEEPQFVSDVPIEDEVVMDEVTLEELPAEVEAATAEETPRGSEEVTIDQPRGLPQLEEVVTAEDLVLEEVALEEAPVEEVELEEAEPQPPTPSLAATQSDDEELTLDDLNENEPVAPATVDELEEAVELDELIEEPTGASNRTSSPPPPPPMPEWDFAEKEDDDPAENDSVDDDDFRIDLDAAKEKQPHR